MNSPLDPFFVRSLHQQLEKQSWCQTESLFSNELLLKLQADALTRFHRGEFELAKVGKGVAALVRANVRSDSICWVEDAPKSLALRDYLFTVNELMAQLSRQMFVPMISFETHYASYPVGGSYEKHLDRFSADDTRVISMVVYLNSEWKPEEGGSLVLYSTDKPSQIVHEVQPRLGTTILFLSEDVQHEVRPALRRRSSLAGWMKRRPK